ncbi:Gfo/Idh/MocA family protein [Sphingomonas qilianensis]|uniref:Gfo/Idh/MocA family oxidoreductase n=1 Tax=Sphingomonas qilianensis TaxID=1736690 RepID=A0ABU9XUK7_9SPHN
MTIAIAVVGLGKIAHDQHLPAIAASDEFTLVAGASPEGTAEGVPVFKDIDALLASGIAVDAIAMCQPPQVRYVTAAKAIRAGKHVLLEKPPGATLAEVEGLVRFAEEGGTTLFAAWHSRYAPAVEQARAWLAGQQVVSADVIWKEDVRRWHPGQQWIWQPGGLGVFDPGINGLSILTRIMPDFIHLADGEMEIPSNRAAPIAARMSLADTQGAKINAEFDWRQTGPQSWDINVTTTTGTLALSKGGSELVINGVSQPVAAHGEYPALYADFARLIRAGKSDTDRSPLRLVADAFLRSRHVATEPFID